MMSTFKPLVGPVPPAPPGYTATFKKAACNPMLAVPSSAPAYQVTLRKGGAVAWEGWISVQEGSAPTAGLVVAALASDEALARLPVEAVAARFGCDAWTAGFIRRHVQRRKPLAAAPMIHAAHEGILASLDL
jgi:hypothetical protein